MSCEECKSDKNITLNNMPNYTLDELKQAFEQGNKRSYTGDEIKWFYNLYNRVFNTNKQPGCGKCFMNIRKALTERYKGEMGL